MGRRLVFALVFVFVLVAVAPAAAGAAGAHAWIRPVDGVVARSFDPPRTRFGAGHLGTDFAVAPGTPVRASGPGVVSFAGAVAGSLHVVIAHAGNLRTSYSFLATLRVRRGSVVDAGEVVGTTGGGGVAHDGSVLHMSLRTGDTYVDPMALFGPPDLTAVVHLAPTADPPRPVSTSSERRGLIAGLMHGAAVVLDTAGRAAARRLAAMFPMPAAAVEGTAEWLAQHGHCDAHAPPADGAGGSGHRVMLVAGIDSSLAAGHPALNVPVAKLGYEADEVTYFSYARNGGDYTAADTEGPIMVAARRLGSQLRALQRQEPGREVDLLAHSQGGVVAAAFLALVYKRDDRSYPPLGTVVTLASPLRGAPLASAASRIDRTHVGSTALRVADRLADAVGAQLPLQSAALRDLAVDSAFMRRLDAARLPDEVQLTALGSATDLIVPGDVATRDGAATATVVPIGLNAHTSILNDPSALRVVRSALEGRPPPCESLATALAGKLIPTAIRSLEDGVGRYGAAVGRIADGAQ